MNNDWKTGCMLEKLAFEDIILHANSDTEGEMDNGEIWFDAANGVYKGKNSAGVIQFAIQSDVDALEGRMDTAETNISDLQGRVTIAEGEIDTLQNDMTTAQGDITDLQGRMTTAEGEIDTLHSDLTTLTDRVAVQTDTDGHGKLSYLKEQTTAPAPGADEGVIYTADDGGDTALYYKAGSDVFKLAQANWTDWDQAITTNGYQRLPSGLIIQWGRTTATMTASQYTHDFTYPIAFPVGCLGLWGTCAPNHYPNVLAVNMTPMGTSEGRAMISGAIATVRIDYFAIGY